MELHDKRGRLTGYAFACGYVERTGRITLSREHGCFHIKGFTRLGEGFSTHVWETARTLRDARRIYARLSRVALDA